MDLQQQHKNKLVACHLQKIPSKAGFASFCSLLGNYTSSMLSLLLYEQNDAYTLVKFHTK